MRQRRHKYGAVRTGVDGYTFDSRREARRYGELRLMERAGEIKDLQIQPGFELHAPGGKTIGWYVADFMYMDCRKRVVVVEDVKGFPTPLYKWKKRHVQAEYGITIVEA